MNSKFNQLYNQIISEMIIVEDFKTAAIVWQDIPESKSYIEKFKNELRQKVKSPLNDIEYWIKQGYAAFKDFVDGYKSKNTISKNNIIKTAEYWGAEYLTEINGYELWFIPSYEASKQLGRFYKGKSSSWCISTETASWWYDHAELNIFVFCIQKDFDSNDDFCKVALEITKEQPVAISTWDINDDENTFEDNKIFNYINNNINTLLAKQEKWDNTADQRLMEYAQNKLKDFPKTAKDEYIITSNDDLKLLNVCFNRVFPKLYLKVKPYDPQVVFKVVDPISIKSLRIDRKVENLNQLFLECRNLKYVKLLNTGHIKSFFATFAQCESIESIPSFDVHSADSFGLMFSECYSLKEIPDLNISNSNYKDFGGMFYHCDTLINQGYPIEDPIKCFEIARNNQ